MSIVAVAPSSRPAGPARTRSAPDFPFSASPVVPTTPIRPGWKWHRLTDLARLATGHTPSRRHAEYWNGDIPWLQLPDIRALDGRRAMGTLEHTNKLGIANSAAVMLPENTVCMSRTASVGFVTLMGRPMATSQDFVNWVCGPNLHPTFLMHLLIACRAPIRELGSGAVHHTIYFPTVEAFSVCMPPVPEQERIARWLTAAMAEVEHARAAAQVRLDAAEALRTVFLQHAFDGATAASWPKVRLGELSVTCSGATPSRAEKRFFGGTVPWVKTGELKDGVVSTTEEFVTEAALDECSLPLLPSGTLLIAMYGQGQTRGRTAILGCDATTNQACFAVLPDPARFHSEFLQLWFRASYARLRQLTESRGGNQPNLNGVLLRQLQVPLPSLREQQRVLQLLAKQLDEARQASSHCAEERALIELLPSSLLRQAFCNMEVDDGQAR